MKILVLGGTVFLGRHLVESAVARNHEVTLFNRGQHNSDLFPGLEKLKGDRDGDLSALEGRYWDAVIDPSGYVPRLVGATAKLMASNGVRHYTFISSLAVYRDFETPNVDETAPLAALPEQDLHTEEVTGNTYGPLKVLCEQVAEEMLPGKVLSVRAGYLIGPNDPTDRFTYWPRRIADARNSAMLAPLPGSRPFQVIDARDLSDWIIRMIESNQTGKFNVTGPAPVQPLTLEKMLNECKMAAGTGNSPEIVWVDEGFLKAENLEVGTAFPLCVGSANKFYSHIHEANFDKALANGLVFRPLSETIKDTLSWDATRPADERKVIGLDRSRELELLEKWKGQH